MTSPSKPAVSADFCRALPKIELHAHLSGSVTPAQLQGLWDLRRSDDPDFGVEMGLEPPEVWFRDKARGQNIKAFFAHFGTYIYHLLSNPSSIAYATQSVLQDFAADGVVYLELRTTPRDLPLGGYPPVSAEEAIRVVLEIMNKWNRQGGQTMQARLLLSIDRARHGPKEAVEIVRLAIRLRDEGWPVVGVDLSGDPHVPLKDYRAAFDLARAHDLPSSIHFAEIPAVTPRELDTLLSYGPKRLGHVIHVPPSLRQRILDRDIHVELLLTCNILAGMLPNTSTDPGGHHFGWWYAHTPTDGRGGLSIGTDDVGVFGSWLSEEYELVAEHFGLGREELVGLVRRGIGGVFDEAQREGLEGLISEFESRTWG